MAANLIKEIQIKSLRKLEIETKDSFNSPVEITYTTAKLQTECDSTGLN